MPCLQAKTNAAIPSKLKRHLRAKYKSLAKILNTTQDLQFGTYLCFGVTALHAFFEHSTENKSNAEDKVFVIYFEK